MAEYIDKMLKSVNETKPYDFSNHFDKEMDVRVMEKINSMRDVVVKNMFSSKE